MTSPRLDLAVALDAAAAASLTVWSEEPLTPPALPALVVRPGRPYREPSVVPGCIELWRLEVLALVPIDAALPLDTLDELIALVRDVMRAHRTGRLVDVSEAAVQRTIGGKDQRAAVIRVEINT